MRTRFERRVDGSRPLWLIGGVLVGLLVSAALVGGAEGLSSEEPSSERLPPGVEQLLPRGRIAAVDDPTFVSAADAEIADEAWVLGVLVEGQAKAYSLNLLNRHEVVNDREGSVAYAAVW